MAQGSWGYAVYGGWGKLEVKAGSSGMDATKTRSRTTLPGLNNRQTQSQVLLYIYMYTRVQLSLSRQAPSSGVCCIK